MCYQLVELYSQCKCLYYQHAVDRCASYGRRGHTVTQRTILVGYACHLHSAPQGHSSYSGGQTYSDSGYYSSHSSKSSHRQYRWRVSSSVTGCAAWHSPPLLSFQFRNWVSYLYSFRPRGRMSPSRRPSQLSLLLVGHDRFISTSAPPALWLTRLGLVRLYRVIWRR